MATEREDADRLGPRANTTQHTHTHTDTNISQHGHTVENVPEDESLPSFERK